MCYKEVTLKCDPLALLLVISRHKMILLMLSVCLRRLTGWIRPVDPSPVIQHRRYQPEALPQRTVHILGIAPGDGPVWITRWERTPRGHLLYPHAQRQD